MKENDSLIQILDPFVLIFKTIFTMETHTEATWAHYCLLLTVGKNEMCCCCFMQMTPFCSVTDRQNKKQLSCNF